MYILNRVGESTPPCGTPVLMLRRGDLVWLYRVYCVRPFM